jgi:hypothetical protein
MSSSCCERTGTPAQESKSFFDIPTNSVFAFVATSARWNLEPTQPHRNSGTSIVMIATRMAPPFAAQRVCIKTRFMRQCYRRRFRMATDLKMGRGDCVHEFVSLWFFFSMA